MKLFLKGERCYTEKCSVHAPAVPAGPARPGRASSCRSTPSASARSRRCAASTASSSASSASTTSTRRRRKGRTGEEMLGLLESRLDNVVHRLGFAFTRVAGAPGREAQPRARQRQARQHPELPAPAGRQDRDSRAEPRDRRRSSRRSRRSRSAPSSSWLELDKANFAGVFKGAAGPRRDQRAGRFASSTSSSITAGNRMHPGSAHGQATETTGERVRRPTRDRRVTTHRHTRGRTKA